MRNFLDETINEVQKISGSGRNRKRDDNVGVGRRSEEPMENNSKQAGRDDDITSTGGVSSLDFNSLRDCEIETETFETITEPVEDGTSTLKPPAVYTNLTRDLPESSSPGKLKVTAMAILMASLRRRIKEGAAGVIFLGTFPEEE